MPRGIFQVMEIFIGILALTLLFIWKVRMDLKLEKRRDEANKLWFEAGIKENTVKKCSKCSKEIPKDISFCMHCGNPQK